MGNIELSLFGKGYHTSLFPESKFFVYCTLLDQAKSVFKLVTTQVQKCFINLSWFCVIVVTCLVLALIASGRVHGVCITTWYVLS